MKIEVVSEFRLTYIWLSLQGVLTEIVVCFVYICVMYVSLASELRSVDILFLSQWPNSETSTITRSESINVLIMLHTCPFNCLFSRQVNNSTIIIPFFSCSLFQFQFFKNNIYCISFCFKIAVQSKIKVSKWNISKEKVILKITKYKYTIL